MYAFVVVVTMLLPSLKPLREPQPPQRHILRVYDGDSSDQATCLKRGDQMAERIAKRVPNIVHTEITCSLIETRKI